MPSLHQEIYRTIGFRQGLIYGNGEVTGDNIKLHLRSKESEYNEVF